MKKALCLVLLLCVGALCLCGCDLQSAVELIQIAEEQVESPITIPELPEIEIPLNPTPAPTSKPTTAPTAEPTDPEVPTPTPTAGDFQFPRM